MAVTSSGAGSGISRPIGIHPYGKMTLAAWIYFPGSVPSGAQRIIIVSDVHNSQYMIVYDGGFEAKASSWNATQCIVGTGSTSSFNTWFHLCGTFNDTGLPGEVHGINLYVNGGAAGSDATAVTQMDDSVNLNKIADTPPGLTYVAFPAVWKAVLSAAEVAILAKGFNPKCMHPEALVFYCPASDNSQAQVVDSCGTPLTIAVGAAYSIPNPPMYMR